MTNPRDAQMLDDAARELLEDLTPFTLEDLDQVEEEPPREPETVVAPERDTFDRPIFNAPVDGNFVAQLPEDVYSRLTLHFDKIIDGTERKAANRFRKIARFWELYFAVPPARFKEMERKGAANVHIPMVTKAVDTLQSKTTIPISVVGHEVFDPRPRNEWGSAVADIVRGYIAANVANMKYQSVNDIWDLNAHVEGQGILYGRWVKNLHANEDGVEGINIATADFVISPMTAFDIESATACGHRSFMEFDQLLELQEEGQFENVEKVRFESTIKARTYDPKPELMSVDVGQDAGSEEDDLIPVWELWFWLDLDGDRRRELYVAHYIKDKRVILNIQRNPYLFQRPPYFVKKPKPIPGMFYGLSAIEAIKPLQETLNAIMNRALDAAALAIQPPMEILRGTEERHRDKNSFGPGSYYMTSQKGAVSAIDLPRLDPAIFGLMQILTEYEERVTRTSDPQLGRFETRGRRTAFEVNVTQSEGAKTFDVILNRLKMSGMHPLGWFIVWCLYQYRPEFDSYYSPIGTKYVVTKAMLAGPDHKMNHLEILPTGVESESTREVERQMLMQLEQLIVTNPAFQQFAIMPHTAYARLENLLNKFGLRETERFIGTLEQSQLWQMFTQFMQAMQAQQQQGGNAQGAGTGPKVGS